ncbi:hypothetical protein Lepil_3271 [Leptonema illini DSM 21528]|uniref:Uncharacterized protein n=1 Tax=Leptonema illini DSM 21528 TaxID=929563 RepID=H2CGL4_9LEPT|nr:hypothetical protein Lepil_3271 [Leptonema illini DSM 21528]
MIVFVIFVVVVIVVAGLVGAQLTWEMTRELNSIRPESEQISVFIKYPLKPLYIYGLHQEAFPGPSKYRKDFLIALCVQLGCVLILVVVNAFMNL